MALGTATLIGSALGAGLKGVGAYRQNKENEKVNEYNAKVARFIPWLGMDVKEKGPGSANYLTSVAGGALGGGMLGHSAGNALASMGGAAPAGLEVPELASSMRAGSGAAAPSLMSPPVQSSFGGLGSAGDLTEDLALDKLRPSEIGVSPDAFSEESFRGLGANQIDPKYLAQFNSWKKLHK